MKNLLSFTALAGLAVAYQGDLTYYTTGLGSCGFTSTDGDAIVALSTSMVRVHQGIPILVPISETRHVVRESLTTVDNVFDVVSSPRPFLLKK